MGRRHPGVRINAWWIEARDAESAALPPDLGRTPARSFATGLAYSRPAGEPWVRLLALVVAF